MSKAKVILNNGVTKEYEVGSLFYDIAKDNKEDFPILAVSVNNKVTSLYDTLEEDCNINFITVDSSLGCVIYLSGLKLVTEVALSKIDEKASISFDYVVPDGLVASIDTKEKIDDDYVKHLKEKMEDIVKKNLKIEKMIVKRNDALQYYEEKGVETKAANIRNILDPTVVLYKLCDHVGYYYSEMPASTKAINTFDVLSLRDNLILLKYPSDFSHGRLSEDYNNKNIIKTYKKSKHWLDVMNIKYVKDINAEVSKGKAADFVKSCELHFDLEINDVAQFVASNDYIKYVCIAGPSSSGKTTVSKRFSNYLAIYGKDPIVISVDDYYKERVDTPKDENGEYDFESIRALDLQYLARDVDRLLKGEEVTLPKFNFVTGCKEMSSKKVQMKENSILIFEGLHAINDELLPMLDKDAKYKIYVNPLIPLSVDEHNFISTRNVRLLRRIARDNRTRGYNPEHTIKSSYKVRLGESKYITPLICDVNKIINTSLPYEIGALKVLVEPLLYSVKPDSDYYNDARRLLSFLKQFFTINLEYVPKDSIIREFIGGGNDD